MNESGIKKIEYVDNEMAGLRLDIFLSGKIDELTRSAAQKLIDKGMARVNGELVSKKYKICAGDMVEVIFPKTESDTVIPEDIPLDVVYEDDDVVVVDKAKGMVVHPGVGNKNGTLVNAMLYHCKGKLSKINGEFRAGVVHRIDKDTSGLLVMAKNDEAHLSLAEQFKEHSVTRAYKSIVYNNFKNDEGRIDLPIGRDDKNRLKKAVTDKNSKRAITNYRILERFGKFTLIEARLETGRTHQIRVHMAYEKHPLLGDSLYGPEKNRFGATGQVLHAYLLGFIHPFTGEYLEFESPLPKEFINILEKLRNMNNI